MEELLKNLNACIEAQDWAKGKTWQEIFTTCPRGDWLLWLFDKTMLINDDNVRLLILVKGHCANTVRHLITDERSLKAIDTAIAYGEGKATKEELDIDYNYAAAYAGVAAYTADIYVAAAAAGVAAPHSTDSATATADAYAYATYITAYDDVANVIKQAAYDADAGAHAIYASKTAKKENRLLTADICRKYLPIEIWNIYQKIN